jgi:hypothetical protein
MNTTPKMAQMIKVLREEGYAKLMGHTMPVSASSTSIDGVAAATASPVPYITHPPVSPSPQVNLSESQKQALNRRQQALKARQLQAAAKANTVNRDAASFAAEGIVREHALQTTDIPASMRVDGDPLPQPLLITAREHMNSTQGFFTSPYERSTSDKLRTFRSLRNAIVSIQGDSKFAALREIDSIERNIQKDDNYDTVANLYADDILSWLSEMNKVPGDLDILIAKLAESSDNGFVSTMRCKCLIDARNLIESRQPASDPELEVGEVEDPESDASLSEDSDIPPPPKRKVVVKKVQKKVVPKKKKVAAKTAPKTVQKRRG